MASKFCRVDSVVIHSDTPNRRINQRFIMVPYEDRKKTLINMLLAGSFSLLVAHIYSFITRKERRGDAEDVGVCGDKTGL